MALSGARQQCAACEIDIHSPAVYHLGLSFCCEGCSAGGPCTCTYDEQTAAHLDDFDAVDHLGLAFRRPVPAPVVDMPARQLIRETVLARR